MIRHVAALAFILFAGCGNAPTDETLLSSAVLSQFTGGSFQSPRFAALRQRQTETLQIGIASREQTGAVLLEMRDGAFETWLSADDTTITLENGLLHSTRGLGAGLLASELSQSHALISARQNGFADRFHTFLTGNDRTVVRTYRCAIFNEGPRETTLNTGPVQTQLMSEDCSSLTENFRNLYWVDGRGRIVQSRQWAGDYLGPISTRVVR
ncbi:Group 4 capsule polysaccharide lipoprotein gfcB, YjbF [Cognatiyoonia koreensis]|uniref:Group 4 capsule polysaccharide lipoprotein gfcB, YjbF n=1 Tax=Cognatiyoonia koreensis TaxID=364200 RepID=A0A1I0RS59_9RHOB|nr:YjbF family lipoprotein [Cognatiyoonia koreensis]SEW44076.1 Group 4 capsule polysaccharide lipoprotein gfcB, YjbF [Cognatiyoonia koreensis]